VIDPQFLVATTGFLDWFQDGKPKTMTVERHDKAHRMAKQIRQAIRHYVAGTDWPGLPLEKVDFSFKRLDKACDDWDPTNAAPMTALVKCLPAEHAEMSGGYVGAILRVVNYILDQRPHNADVRMQGIRQRPPCLSDQYRWQRCVDVAEEPLLVLQRLHDRRLTSAHVDCLQAMYPAILDVMTSEMIQALASQGKNWNLPRDKERYLALFLGDFSAPELQSEIQKQIAATKSATPPSKAPSTAAGSRVAKSYGPAGQDMR
jgi:hypothetical protein